MPQVRVITDSDIDFYGQEGRTVIIRNHPIGYKGLVILGRETCPYCAKAYAAADRLASRYADVSPIYRIDITDPACGIATRKWRPQGVPHFVRVNKLGKVDTEEWTVDYSNEAAFLSAIRRLN